VDIKNTKEKSHEKKTHKTTAQFHSFIHYTNCNHTKLRKGKKKRGPCRAICTRNKKHIICTSQKVKEKKKNQKAQPNQKTAHKSYRDIRLGRRKKGKKRRNAGHDGRDGVMQETWRRVIDATKKRL